MRSPPPTASALQRHRVHTVGRTLSPPAPPRSAELAAALSFWVPGLGQLYARSWRRGATVGATSALLTALAIEALSPAAILAGEWPESPRRAALLWGLSLAVWLWNIPDASRSARSRTRAAGPAHDTRQGGEPWTS